eukprot:gene36612-45158_t
MNKGWGGKQRELHDSVMTEGCLGTSTTIAPQQRLQVGETQHMCFREGDSPPHFTPHAQKYDRLMSDAEIAVRDAARQRAKAKRRAAAARAAVNGSNHLPVSDNVSRDDDSDSDSESDSDDDESSEDVQTPAQLAAKNTIPGYIGKPKGVFQILWERGLYKPEMVLKISEKAKRKRAAQGRPPFDLSLDASLTLSQCEDFRNERGVVQQLLEDAGHILLVSPVCHPEVAGVGIEYSWGVAKLHQRRHNDCVAKHLHDLIVESLNKVTIESVLKSARRTREYCRAYEQIAANRLDPKDITFTMVEGMKKLQKTHRSILDLDARFVKSDITNTSTSLAVIPLSISESLGVIVEQFGGIVIPGGSEGHVLDVFTCSVTGAVIWAGGSVASFAFISIEASAFSDISVADSTASTLSIFVESSLLIRSINPSQLERADTVGTISTIVGESNSPIIITLADIISHTGSVTTAIVVTV